MVEVTWDGVNNVEIRVDSNWKGDVCGLCGNYNDNANDEFVNFFGTTVS